MQWEMRIHHRGEITRTRKENIKQNEHMHNTRMHPYTPYAHMRTLSTHTGTYTCFLTLAYACAHTTCTHACKNTLTSSQRSYTLSTHAQHAHSACVLSTRTRTHKHTLTSTQRLASIGSNRLAVGCAVLPGCKRACKCVTISR